MPQARTEPGFIIRSQSGFFTIQTASDVLTCRLRGRLKQGPQTGDLAAVGDRVQISRQKDGTGTIESIETRRSALVRLDPRPQGMYQQVLLANLDQAVFVFACAHPPPRLRMLDRFLVIAEKQGIPAVIVVNKIDLVGKREAKKLFGHYPSIGYPVLYTSALKGRGIRALRKQLAGKISAMAGPSGVGKSSLLNSVQPGLGLVVQEISTFIGKGRHTTTVRELFPLEGGGYVADMPGMRSLALWDTEAVELDGYFPEISPLVTHCQFNNCTHNVEPGCAVVAAVESGRIRADRYDSYLRLRAGEE